MTEQTGGARTADYEYELPPDRIAQHPSAGRDDCRLLIVDRARETTTHARFRDLVGLIPRGDAIVLNTSRVIRARLLGTRAGGGKAEVFLLRPRDDGAWEALVRPSARIKEGGRIVLGDDTTIVVGGVTRQASGVGRQASGVEAIDLTPDARRLIRFESELSLEEILKTHGHTPLPPYIGRPDTVADVERYQTVYAREPGSVAAPTAGLHVTDTMLDAFAENGVRRADVTLHVGAGTFKPVDVSDPAHHSMHHEQFTLGTSAAATLNATRDSGSNVWAVGTTSLRVLESVVHPDGRFQPRSGETDIFIRPPHVVRGADRLVTNFHLPRSTLLMLVAAFAGYDLTMRAYKVAIAGGYQFYSYGDAMCVI